MSTNAERRAAYKKKWTQDNKEHCNAKAKAWAKNNPEKRKEIVKKYKDANKDKACQYILDNYEWYIFNAARTRARVHQVEFNLEKTDIVIPEFCPYLEVPLTRIQGKGRQDFNPSLDRIDPTKGYTRDNIEIISDKANRMKNNASPTELLTFAKNINLKLLGDSDTLPDLRHGKVECLIKADVARYEEV